MTGTGEGALILMIEDDLGLAELVREEIVLRGWAFMHAASGKDAIPLLAGHRPDLVILDFTLPDMTALDLLQRTEMPPFLVTTGSGDERVAVAIMKQGALDYLVKDTHFLGNLPLAVERALHSVQVERRLAEAQDRLRAADEAVRNAQKMESLGRMAGGIAHDFNNLFQAIQGNLEVACLRAQDNPEAREPVERALKVLAKASVLAHQMLDFSGKGFRRSEPLDLNRMVRDCLVPLRDLPALAGGIHFTGAPDLPPIEGDSDQLAQVLTGLLANAREAVAPAGGAIRIGTAIVSPEATGSQGGQWIHPAPLGEALVCLTLEDTGPGMAREVLAKAFDPFFSTHRPGRGLGLSAALGILKGHGAGLWVRTAPGKGTTFRVLFQPAAAGLEAPADAPAPQADLSRTILLVDDDEDLQETLGEYLRDHLGYPVLQARDGLEAVDLYHLEQDRIGLILMDATMPRMTGPDAFKVIRELDPGARAVLCSGFSEEAGTKVAREFGFAEFLKKPFSLATLQETIVRVMGRA